MNETFRGVIKGQTLVVLDSPAPLADGTPVEVMRLRCEPGSSAAILAAMEAEPRVTLEDVGELNRAIAAGRRSAGTIDPFPNDTEASGPV